MIKIKICGITNLKDAILICGLGADYFGFNFYRKSPRKISTGLAKEIISKLPQTVQPVGVFVDEEIETITDIVKQCGLKLVQLHGKEQPEYCENLKSVLSPEGIGIIKAFRIKSQGSLRNLTRYKDIVDFFLLDTYVPGKEGGTGEVFNWDSAIKAKDYGKPIFLAGGLTPENVVEAVSKVEPYAVDVCSGVERLPRRKDYDKTKQFIAEIKMPRKKPKI